ncbi:delta-guaiene synthase 3-like [Pistacia vera]|uniref:delta-guaiene synthase 3-like n=1 Tax=Pistacia vera TaxID=55513 RepID=UPI001263D643|nr:delta-guaiene synthase 3-like [Pistacia vera]
MKALVRAYFVEAIWFNTKYVPTFEEYLEISVMSSGYPMLSVQALVGLEEVATKEAFDWAISVPRILRSSALIAHLVDDIHTYKVEEERRDAPSGVQCYMKDHNVSEEEACKKIKEMVDIAWKNINEEIHEPNHPPLLLLLPSLNLARMMEVLYQNGDCYM